MLAPPEAVTRGNLAYDAYSLLTNIETKTYANSLLYTHLRPAKMTTHKPINSRR